MVEINEEALMRAIQPGVKKLEAEYGVKQRAILNDIALTRAGQPANEIYDEIVRRCQAEIPGWQPHEDKVRAIAEQIEARRA
jgi:hypothetical protein